MKSTVLAASAVTLTIAMLAGCASNSTTQPATETSTAPATNSSATSSAIGNTGNASSKDTDAQPVLVVRFAFDSSVLDDASRRVVEDNAKYLMNHPNAKIRIEGHADERGTREYNLALGERRAQAVAKILRALGVTGNRVETVSYGEERPIAKAHDETAWAQNRRDEFVYNK